MKQDEAVFVLLFFFGGGVEESIQQLLVVLWLHLVSSLPCDKESDRQFIVILKPRSLYLDLFSSFPWKERVRIPEEINQTKTGVRPAKLLGAIGRE